MDREEKTMKGAPGIIALVLDEETREQLKTLAVHRKVYCHHITLAYKPTPEVSAKYEKYIGKTIGVAFGRVFLDTRGQAIEVLYLLSQNAVSHVTISCEEGTPPAYSNTLLSKTANNGLED